MQIICQAFSSEERSALSLAWGIWVDNPKLACSEWSEYNTFYP